MEGSQGGGIFFDDPFSTPSIAFSDFFGNAGYLAWALAYPLLVGSLCAVAGYALFRRSDLP